MFPGLGPLRHCGVLVHTRSDKDAGSGDALAAGTAPVGGVSMPADVLHVRAAHHLLEHGARDIRFPCRRVVGASSMVILCTRRLPFLKQSLVHPHTREPGAISTLGVGGLLTYTAQHPKGKAPENTMQNQKRQTTSRTLSRTRTS